MLVKDIMTREVTSVGPETTVSEIAQRLAGRRISAVPVVDATNRVLGIVSESDLFRRSEIETEPKRHPWLALFTTGDELAREYVAGRARHAADVMTKNVITTTEDEELRELAELFETTGIKHAPVVRGGELVGIVSRADLVRALARATIAGAVDTPRDDRSIADALRKSLASEAWADLAVVTFTVHDGVVDLYGLVPSPERRQALRVAAENTPGVKRVEDKLSTHPARSI